MEHETTYPCPVCSAPFPSGVALGGHAKTHNKPVPELDFAAMLPRPSCFEDDDQWEFACRRLREERPNTRTFTRDFAFREACGVCTLSYQAFAKKEGTCNPLPSAQTPERRAARGIDDMDDEPLAVAV